ncbi:hypothetical protein [Streptomyces sp. NPDC056227]|uniref:hypothetical protein n=1 Tax=Streptomyces sp. NPDC056227 TaxID=3345753 RepID=UPI0035DB08B1
MYAALPRAYRNTLQAVPSPGIDINMTQRLAHGGARSRQFGFAALFRNVHLFGSTGGIVRFFDAGHQVVAVGRARCSPRVREPAGAPGAEGPYHVVATGEHPRGGDLCERCFEVLGDSAQDLDEYEVPVEILPGEARNPGVVRVHRTVPGPPAEQTAGSCG